MSGFLIPGYFFTLGFQNVPTGPPLWPWPALDLGVSERTGWTSSLACYLPDVSNAFLFSNSFHQLCFSSALINSGVNLCFSKTFCFTGVFQNIFPNIFFSNVRFKHDFKLVFAYKKIDSSNQFIYHLRIFFHCFSPAYIPICNDFACFTLCLFQQLNTAHQSKNYILSANNS